VEARKVLEQMQVKVEPEFMDGEVIDDTD